MDTRNSDSYAKIIYFKEFVNPKTKQNIFKTVVMLKTFTSTTFVGIEALYKPSGYPSFELLSYIMDADINTIRIVMDDNEIDPTQVFACGDIKDIFTKKVFKSAMVVRVDKPDNKALVDQILTLKRKNPPVTEYDGHPRDG